MQPSTHRQPMIGPGREMDGRQCPVCLPSHLRAEWDMVIRAHHNVLLAGTSSATSEILVAMGPHLRKPVQQYRPRIGASVPQPLEGTLILLEVDSLDLKQQTALLRWLDQGLRVQVVSMTCKPLFALVETGVFLPDLYYRLNVVRIELNAAGGGNL